MLNKLTPTYSAVTRKNSKIKIEVLASNKAFANFLSLVNKNKPKVKSPLSQKHIQIFNNK